MGLGRRHAGPAARSRSIIGSSGGAPGAEQVEADLDGLDSCLCRGPLVAIDQSPSLMSAAVLLRLENIMHTNQQGEIVMRAVLVANPKGGAGKTTLATNLAGHFANEGRNVTLCDLDRQQSALRWMASAIRDLLAVTGYFAGNQLRLSLPRESDW